MALDYSIIGERIRKARLENNITQEKLAEELDVSIAFVSRIECGTTHINLKRLSQICNILNIKGGIAVSNLETINLQGQTIIDGKTINNILIY